MVQKGRAPTASGSDQIKAVVAVVVGVLSTIIAALIIHISKNIDAALEAPKRLSDLERLTSSLENKITYFEHRLHQLDLKITKGLAAPRI